MTQDRNWDDPRYKKFRQDVLRRDSYKCKWPNCESNKSLRVHHIRTWSQYPELRFEVDNGITLCRKHHDFIWGKENNYAQLFITIIKRKENSNDKRSRQSSKNKDATKVSKQKTKTRNKKSKKTGQSFAEKYLRAKKRLSRRR